MLLENAVLDALRPNLSRPSASTDRPRQWGGWFRDKASYLQEHGDARLTDRTDGKFSYFETARVPSRNELLQRFAPDDPLLRQLMEAGVAPEELCVALGYFEECGEAGFVELYRFRPLWGVFLAVTNMSNTTLFLRSMEGSFTSGGQVLFRPFEDTSLETAGVVDLPGAPLAPNMTAIIPVGIALAPLHHVVEDEWSSVETELERARIQLVRHTSIAPADRAAFRLLGPAWRPTRIRFEVQQLSRYQEVHALDLSNLYTVSRHWQMGSCPHLFLRSASCGRLAYWRELFARQPCSDLEEFLFPPEGYDQVLIAELEDETTHVHRLRIGGRVILESLRIHRGAVVNIDLKTASLVTAEGRYVPHWPELELSTDPWRRNEVVGEFLSRRNGPRHLRAVARA